MQVIMLRLNDPGSEFPQLALSKPAMRYPQSNQKFTLKRLNQ